MAPNDLHHLADRLVEDGPDAHHDELRTVAELAVGAGASPVLAAIVVSRDDPPIARVRAFSNLLRELAASPKPSSWSSGTAA